jgi:hypothetical protein
MKSHEIKIQRWNFNVEKKALLANRMRNTGNVSHTHKKFTLSTGLSCY